MDTINADMEKQKGSIIQQLRRTPLEIKILILIVICLTLGFGTYVVYSLNSESKALVSAAQQQPER